MTEIMLDAAFAAQLAGVTGEVLLRDQTGKVLGRYAPQRQPTIEEVIAACPTPPEERDRRVRQTMENLRNGKPVGRTLSEIWPDLERRAGEAQH